MAQEMDPITIPVLYISYDGLTDPLGQSQILPYLAGINKKYKNITILSAEKYAQFEKNEQAVRKLLAGTSIEWKYIFYHRKPAVVSTLYDIFALRSKAAQICKNGPCIVHCRSYIAAIIGLWLKRKKSAKLVFDMRGFWADERVDGGIWNLKNPLFLTIYRYFKKKEAMFFEHSDAIISLTESGKKEICRQFGINENKITVIPCCADRILFDPIRMDEAAVDSLKAGLGIEKNDFIIAYLGSIGTWYLLDEMLEFYKQLKVSKPTARFLFITNDAPETIEKRAAEAGLDKHDIIIANATRKDVPVYLKTAHIGLFFIKKAYSKLASSPTKMGEFLSMGIPVIGNEGVGDVGEIIKKTNCGIAVIEFTPEEYNKCIAQIDRLTSIGPEVMFGAAKKHFDLENGVIDYLRVYASLTME